MGAAQGPRADVLYLRLKVFQSRTPALRERMEALRGLADAFIAAFCHENGLKTKTIDESVYSALALRKFPGNVRELKNVIERAAILSGDTVTIADLPEDPHANPFDDDATPTTAVADEPNEGGRASDDF